MSEARIQTDLLLDAVSTLPADSLTPGREQALADFAKHGLPDRRHEDWKYTSLAPVIALSNAWLSTGRSADKPEPTKSALAAEVQKRIDAHWITVVDGQIQLDKTLTDPGVPGFSATLLSSHEASENAVAADSLGNLNAALLRDGLRIVVTAEVALTKPVGLLFDNQPGSVAQERIEIDVQENASLSLVECHLSDSGLESFTNSVITIDLAQCSRLDHVRIQQTHESHLLIEKTNAALQRDAIYRYTTFDFGGQLVRSDLTADLRGPGARADLHGLYLAGEAQHMDNHLCVNHFVGPADSNQDYRGILNGNARCVFNGKAVVFQGADGTDARQSNHNLLLSDNCEIDTKPELEIYADDVKCSHGATVGQLDRAALYYLRSRGINREEAAQMLTRAFAAGTLSEIPVEQCREFVAELLDAKLAAMEVR
jgi:Fe-S cluster assembly protein SufD